MGEAARWGPHALNVSLNGPNDDVLRFVSGLSENTSRGSASRSFRRASAMRNGLDAEA